MTESTTHRWPAPVGARAAPTERPPEVTPPPPDAALAMTLVSDRAPVRPLMAAPVVFPGYEILGELGRGGMGVVYKARQRNLNRLVALKVILGGPLASEEDKARFRIEAEAAARLHHPNIVQVYDVGEHAGFSFMSLELIEGETLRQWQHGRQIDPAHAARLVALIARAIQHAHEQGIVHRDLKPANILLAPLAHDDSSFPLAHSTRTAAVHPSAARSRSGAGAAPLAVAPKVTDFGLAKSLVGGSDLTITGVACGTPNYMAPEQVRGQPPSPGVDVYGLGALLFELLAGRPPFVGADPQEVMNQIVRLDAPNARKFARNVPRDLAVIVAKCLEKDPARRYTTARDAADDLDRFLSGKPIAARPVGTAERAWRWVRRNPVPAGFLFVLTVGCLATGTLAVALAKSETEERLAHAGAEEARKEAEQQRVIAEQARDELSRALTDAQAARVVAETEKSAAQTAREAAKQDAARAVQQTKEADAARKQSEADLRVAAVVIRDGLRELARHPKFEDADFRVTRNILLAAGRKFRDAVTASNTDTTEWLEVLSDVSHWLGYMEFLNDNNSGAAVEYRAAADAAAKWAKLAPTRTEPRARQCASLVNCGNALFNVGRYPDAEKCYRTAVALIDVVVSEAVATADRAGELAYRKGALEAHEQLANLLRALSQITEWERVAHNAVEHAWGLLRAGGETPDNLRALTTAQQNYGRALLRCGKGDEAECHFARAVAQASRPLNTTALGYVPDQIAALLALAEFQNTRNHANRAGETFRTTVGTLELIVAKHPAADQAGADLAGASARYAEFLRGRGQYEDAEKRYNLALEATAVVLRRAPAFLPARNAAVVAAIGRAHLYNQTNRHREAAAEWSRLAAEDPDPRARTSHELFVLQSLLFARIWRDAAGGAIASMAKPQPGWMLVDLARVWCLTAKQAEADPTLKPEERASATKAALTNAVVCLERARIAGEFENPIRLNYFNANKDFAAIRDKFDPKKK